MSAQKTTAIAVNNLCHSYQRGGITTCILQDLTLNVKSGQSVALIGRSGSGKSTLLNLISGLEPITKGDVLLHGTSIKRLSDNQRTRLRGREIGFIYQAFNLIPTLSIADNIALPLALAGMRGTQLQRRLEPLLEAVGLQDRGRDFPDRLSGGEQQRVAIARALIHQPALILADEPTGNLDAESGRLILQLLGDLVQQQGSAMLLVTHSLEVARVADKVMALDQGQVMLMKPSQLSGSSAW